MVRRIRLGLKILMNQFNANLILITLWDPENREFM